MLTRVFDFWLILPSTCGFPPKDWERLLTKPLQIGTIINSTGTVLILPHEKTGWMLLFHYNKSAAFLQAFCAVPGIFI
ncbi:MAG TPA: hypothetical protein IAC82_07375 [Candidatus Merdivicinus intestinigallinarum]|nr:hypothetical protein [Candidatus Merdivicinus intestinigallinarum]